jgi:hypothetical protein
MHPILEHCTKAAPRWYTLQRIDRTVEYRGWVPDQVPEDMRVIDFWAVSDDDQGGVGRQAAYVTTAWTQPGWPVSFQANPLFLFDDSKAMDTLARAKVLPSEAVANFQRYLAARKFVP